MPEMEDVLVDATVANAVKQFATWLEHHPDRVAHACDALELMEAHSITVLSPSQNQAYVDLINLLGIATGRQ